MLCVDIGVNYNLESLLFGVVHENGHNGCFSFDKPERTHLIS